MTSPFLKSMNEVLQMPNKNKYSVLVPSSKERMHCKSFIGNRGFFIKIIRNAKKCK